MSVKFTVKGLTINECLVFTLGVAGVMEKIFSCRAFHACGPAKKFVHRHGRE